MKKLDSFINHTIEKKKVKLASQNLLIPLKRGFTAIERGIKKVGVGKKGSQNLPLDLINEIVDEIKKEEYAPVTLGAFLAGLIFKGIDGAEKKIIKTFPFPLNQPITAENLFSLFFPIKNQVKKPLVKNLQFLLNQLLLGKTFNKNQAFEIGKFLLNQDLDENFSFFKGFFISYLRVRYESREEWLGILKALDQKTLKIKIENKQKSYLLFSEPFNGFKNQFFLSPILGNYFSKKSYISFHHLGRNSGPKFIMNLYDVVKEFNYPWFRGDLQADHTPWGYFINQEIINPALDNWVEQRWLTVKRPCWATLEKFLSPFLLTQGILITSAFHPPYLEKMITLGEDYGYQAVVVSKLGLEGGLIPSIHRHFILEASKKVGSVYKRKSFRFSFNDLEWKDPSLKIKGIDKKYEISPAKNVSLMKRFLQKSEIEDKELKARFELAVLAYQKVIAWIEEK